MAQKKVLISPSIYYKLLKFLENNNRKLKNYHVLSKYITSNSYTQKLQSFKKTLKNTCSDLLFIIN